MTCQCKVCVDVTPKMTSGYSRMSKSVAGLSYIWRKCQITRLRRGFNTQLELDIVATERMFRLRKNPTRSHMEWKLATSITWTRTQDPDPKNLDPEKPGINIGLKNMSDFRELFYEDHTQCELLFKSSCTNRYLN